MNSCSTGGFELFPIFLRSEWGGQMTSRWIHNWSDGFPNNWSKVCVNLRADGCSNWPLFIPLHLALRSLWLSDKKHQDQHRIRGDCGSAEGPLTSAREGRHTKGNRMQPVKWAKWEVLHVEEKIFPNLGWGRCGWATAWVKKWGLS